MTAPTSNFIVCYVVLCYCKLYINAISIHSIHYEYATMQYHGCRLWRNSVEAINISDWDDNCFQWLASNYTNPLYHFQNGRHMAGCSTVNMSSAAHKETQSRPHPFTPETKPNRGVFLITAIIFQHSLYLTEPRMEGICSRRKTTCIYFLFICIWLFQVSISLKFVFPLTVFA